MRTYGQYCALAKGLDVIGDRWSLLIVRELLIRGRCRYTDLQRGLPGIATNLLAERVDGLEKASVLARETAPPPLARTLFYLTPHGEALARVIEQIGLWAAPLMAKRSSRDAFRSHWLILPFELYLVDNAPRRPPAVIQVRAGDEPVVIETTGGRVRARVGVAEQPDGVIAGAPELVVGILMGRVALSEARKRGLRYEGDPAILRRVQPRHRRGLSHELQSRFIDGGASTHASHSASAARRAR